MSLKLGVPSKGRLMDKTFDWFAQRGIALSRTTILPQFLRHSVDTSIDLRQEG